MPRLRSPLGYVDFLAEQLRREELTDPYSGGPAPQPPLLVSLNPTPAPAFFDRWPVHKARPRDDAQRVADLALLAAAPQPKTFIIHGQRLTTDVPAGLRALGLNILADDVEREALSLEDAKVEDLAVEDLAVEDLDDVAPLGHA